MHPRAEPGRHRLFLWKAGSGGGACLAGCRQTLPFRNPLGGLPSLSPAYPAFSLLSCPHPPSPLPGGKGEIQSLFRRGLPPPAPLQSGGKRHWRCFWKTVFLAFREKVFHSGQGIQAAQVFPMPHGYKPDSKPTAEAAKPILQSPKSQPPSDTAREPQVRAPT